MNILARAFRDPGFVGPPDPSWCPALWGSREFVGNHRYVSGFGGKYIWYTCPWDAPRAPPASEELRIGEAYARHLAASLVLI